MEAAILDETLDVLGKTIAAALPMWSG